MRKIVINYLKKRSGQPVRRRELARSIGIKERDYRRFRGVVKELIDSGNIFKVRGGKLVLFSSLQRFTGTLFLTSHGYGFVTTKKKSNDIFVARKNLNGALHGDSVEVVFLPGEKRHRGEGIVERIVSRITNQFVGIVTTHRGQFWLQIEPVSPQRGIVLEWKNRKELMVGDIVSAKVLDWGTSHTPVTASVVERIGSIDQAEDDMAVICFKYDLTPSFPTLVEKESKKWSVRDIHNEIPNRTDLRNLPTVTIDPWDARDVDDAVSIKEIDNGNIMIGVHIADVSFFVQEGSELDREARKRGNTVYFAEGTVRMLPDNLSAELCSLLSNVDRLALSVLMELDSDCNVISSELKKSVIKSDSALTYRQVQEVIDGKDGSYSKELLKMNQIAKRLTVNRREAGSIDFDIPEPIFKFRNGGIPHEISRSERLDSHCLVEEFMLLANREISKKVIEKRKEKDEFIFRIHDEPSTDDMDRFIRILRRLNLGTDIPPRLKPRDFRDILAMVEASPYRNLIEKLALRTMSKAVYSVHNRGHFGLAFHTYTHFTSPIRRYSDIMVHRYLKKHLMNHNELKDLSRNKASIVAKEVTEIEIKSVEAEREYIKLKQIRWLSQHIGEKFDAVISGVISAGFFAELENTMVEGFVSLESLPDDNYYFDELEIAIIGKRFKEIYRLGRKVHICVKSVSLDKRQANFEVLDS